MNIMFGFRTLYADPDRSQALVEAVKICPFADLTCGTPTRLISPGGRSWSGDQPRGLQYWQRLHNIYQDEIVDEPFTGSTYWPDRHWDLLLALDNSK